MRITLLANHDIASNLAINALVKRLPQHQYQILLSDQVGSKTDRPEGLRQLAFYEQGLFNQILFPALAHLANAPQGKTKSFEHLAKNGIPVQLLQSLDNAHEHIVSGLPELIISIRFGFILTPDIIVRPQFGVLNLHSGILPDFRGVMATFWSMLNGSEVIGTTLHYIQDTGIDTGDIIAIDTQAVQPMRSYLWNLLSLYQAGVTRLCDAIEQIDNGLPLNSKPQDQKGQYFSFPTLYELEQFERKGFKLTEPDDLIQIASWYV